MKINRKPKKKKVRIKLIYTFMLKNKNDKTQKQTKIIPYLISYISNHKHKYTH